MEAATGEDSEAGLERAEVVLLEALLAASTALDMATLAGWSGEEWRGVEIGGWAYVLGRGGGRKRRMGERVRGFVGARAQPGESRWLGSVFVFAGLCSQHIPFFRAYSGP